MLQGNVKTFDVIVKKMGEESTRATELALEGQSLFTSGRKHTIKLGQQLLRASLASCCIEFFKT